MQLSTFIVGSPINGFFGLASLITAVIIFIHWRQTRNSLQLVQWILLVMLALLNITEYYRLDYFEGVDVDPVVLTGGLSGYRSALSGYDSNLYWHHLLWFLTPILFLGVILSSLFALKIMKKREGSHDLL
jgi:hypothetical protein